VWHPDLTEEERAALKVVYDLRYEYDRAVIEQTEVAKKSEGGQFSFPQFANPFKR
jgi:hypothetical protein